MVVFYNPQKTQSVTKNVRQVVCEDLDINGKGLVRIDDKVCFVEGLVPQDVAKVTYTLGKNFSKKSNNLINNLEVLKIISPSPLRRQGDCVHMDCCGGCPLQHINPKFLLEKKIAGLRRLFLKNLGVNLDEPAFVLESRDTCYRRACRLAVRIDHKKVILGFRESKSHNLVKLDRCLDLTDRINNAIADVLKVLNAFSLKGNIGHVEFLDSDGLLGIYVRINGILLAHDEDLLKNLGKKINAVISVGESFKHEISGDDVTKERVVDGNTEELFVHALDCKIPCLPSSFVQINKDINERLLKSVIDFIEPQEKMCVLDLFCGIGNFSFPLASKMAKVVGVDIVSTMINNANLYASSLTDKQDISFEIANLDEPFENQKWALTDYDAAVLDPGRSGAKRAVAYLAQKKIPKLAYISCNPQAASRDLSDLIESGYKIVKFGVCDMFPRTAHIESVYLLARNG